MKDFIHRLPIDIVLQIIPYTYNVQDKDLLNDIVNYKETKSLLLKLYYNYWIVYAEQENIQQNRLLINDIFAYFNDVSTIV